MNSLGELIIIENSPESKLKKIEEGAPFIKYHFANENLGYGKAHNIGIRKSIDVKKDYHLVLNPDINFNPEIIPEILLYMDQHPDIGLLMPKILYNSGETQYLCKKLPAPFDLVVRRFLPSFLKKALQKRIDAYELRDKDYNKIMEVPNLSGCFMFMRTAVLEKIGGFDERFFMYLEDVDLSRRIGQISKTVYYPEVHVLHGYEKASYKNSKLFFYHIQSAIRYFNKWGWLFDKERKKVNNKIS